MYDIAVIGAGITGCSIARELSRYNVRILLIEKNSDVADGTTKANSAIVHAGYDAKPGTLKARFNVPGALMYEKLCS
ncbi:MAG TPA: FAD-dependent oxidoreductase, partial [Bacillota bacterium]|nr:FAD-dependent oxidoreductase [Bacillota bacterium]